MKNLIPADVSLEELKRGYRVDTKISCLFCSHTTELGYIYSVQDQMMDAERAMQAHIKQVHGDVFTCLLAMDKQITGISEHQAALLKLFYEGKSDLEVMQALNIGSASTVRNHRALMREREQQAKILLALMTILKDSGKKQVRHVEPHATATMVDDRYRVTPEEEAEMLRKYFPNGLDGRILNFSMREKGKIVVLRQLTKRFQNDTVYTEKQVNDILKTADADFATLRRYMIEYGFMSRTSDGRAYRLQPDKPVMQVREQKTMKKEVTVSPSIAGVYAIRNVGNNKLLVCATLNLKTMESKRFQLSQGLFPNQELQSDWTQAGEAAFKMEVLETLPELPVEQQTERLYEVEKKWLTALQPFGEKGYNRQKLQK